MLPASSPAAPEALPLCPVHPERPSVATCERCGRFLCEACAVSREPSRCADCDARLGDPLGIFAQPFSVGGSLSLGWRLFREALPGLLAVSFLFGIVGGTFTHIVDQNTQNFATSMRWSRLFEGTVGLFAVGAHLALLVGVAEGRRLTFVQALEEGLLAWPRLFGANFRSRLWIGLFFLLLIIPGIIKAVTLALVTEAAYREPGQDALQSSTQLVTGRRWEVFGMLAAAYGILLAVVVPMGLLMGALAEAAESTSLVGDILLDGVGRGAEAFVSAVGLVAFYGLKRVHGQALAPR
jgi:hypothetical protein